MEWVDSFEYIIERQNLNDELSGPLSTKDLLSCGTYLEDSSAVPVSVLIELFNIEDERKQLFIDQLLAAYPLMYLHLESPFIINIWQGDLFSEELSSYMNEHKNSI